MKHFKLYQKNYNIQIRSAVVLLLIFIIVNCSPKKPHEKFKPPIAKEIPEKITIHGHTRIDNYSWLQDPNDPEVIEHLNTENEFSEKVMAHTLALQETIFEEIKLRTKETDLTVPERRGDYFYYERMEEGKEYPIYARKRGSLDVAEEIYLDVNELAPTEGFFGLGLLMVSPKQDILAFFSTTNGQSIGTINFKNLSTGKMLEDKILEIKARPHIMSWANDNQTLFYLKFNAESGRFHQVYRHTLGTKSSEDVPVFEEKDKSRGCWLSMTKSQQYLIISSFADLREPGWEHHYLDANEPYSSPKFILHRDWNTLMDVGHFRDYFYFLTSDKEKNLRLVKTPIDHTERENWEEVISPRDDIEVLEFRIFQNHLVVVERMNGLRQFRIHSWSGDEEFYVDFGETTYMVAWNGTSDFNSETFRYSYWSLTTPHSLYEYSMRTGEKVLLKQEEVSGGFESDDYISERLYAPSRDGVRIPISVVYKKALKKDGSNPLLLMAYGAYGSPMRAVFNTPRLSLLDRGFVYAIAHVRGGGMLGLKWHEEGKLLKKKNTFNDFIDVAEHLIAKKYTSPKKLFATGRSAGGTLMGAISNMRSDLFKGIIAEVPLVALLPPPKDEKDFTDSEIDPDFGDPNIEEHYHYMVSYSPYENVETRDYPNILVITALNDASVHYWGPAKWVSKLRALKTDNNMIILKTDMEGGHSGEQKRYQQWRDIAFSYAFLLDLAGIKE